MLKGCGYPPLRRILRLAGILSTWVVSICPETEGALMGAAVVGAAVVLAVVHLGSQAG